jgi:hypothetical protein
MAFIISGGNVISFAEYSDVTATDVRLFEANEGLTVNVIEDALEKATARILSNIRASDWWKTYYIRQSGADINPRLTTSGLMTFPSPNANLIKDRQQDFTDLCVYYGLSEFILPSIADFGNADTAERKKISFYDEKYRKLFEALLEAGDWYDFSNDGTIVNSEKMPTRQNLVRVR